MNRIKILSIAMLAAAVVFSSCGKDDEEDDIIPSGPSLTVMPTDFEGWYGDTLNVAFEISSNDEITGLEVTPSTNDLSPISFGPDSLSGDFFATGSVQYILPSGGNWDDGDSFTISFIATNDVDGTSYTTTQIVTVTYDQLAGSTPMTDVMNGGTLFHILGNGQGSWDLTADMGISSGANNPNSDMVHVWDGLAGTFNQQWEPGKDAVTGDYVNFTTYVLADAGFDYDNATVESATSAYAAGTAMTLVDFNVGDIFIANLDGAGVYAVIKIEAINTTMNDNEDNMTFMYKK